VAVAGYNLCPQVTIGDIIGEMRHACLFLWQRTGQRLMVYGHSAGGHLTGAMLATDWHGLYPKMPADFVPSGYAISGLFDLTPLLQVASAKDLCSDPEETRRVSPVFWQVPQGRVFDAVVGAQESSEFLRQSRLVADAWGKAGVATRYQEIADTNHFTVLGPLTDPNSAMVARLVELASKVK
jgi:arylformamidase